MNVELSNVHTESSLCEMYYNYSEKGRKSIFSSQSTFSRNTASNLDDIWNFLNTNTSALS